MTPRRVFLIRHGQTEMNVRRIVQGPRLDPPLSAKGKEQARALGKRLVEEPLTAVFVSPMLRARETADAVARLHGLTPRILAGLTEYDWGLHCGREETGATAEAMRSVFQRWWAGDLEARPAEGESAREAELRVRAAFASALAESEGTIAVVAHGRINKILLASLLAGDLTRQEDFPQYNTGLTLLELGEEGEAAGIGGGRGPESPGEVGAAGGGEGGRADVWMAGKDRDPATGRWRLVYVNDTTHRIGVDVEPGGKLKETNA